ncbi:hypothetical protein CGN00_14260 [Salmonella enterica]|nr:hypothetical protein [Salmonella enterica]EBG6864470.1 hypothetical protein [Salmonella enterica subsp. enterica serovar Muenster]ECA6103921.1 hypothetical protein [Salmonella enterica subsp. enterica serovar Oranienburg]ECH4007455.1 hypothetical protein [Salmonella enterica subsp. enterica serovar Montevideo]EDC8049601.1 hypothetical protein [Salmonella enterica subsp. enterica serovar Muenchen]EED3332132.1 hypothetical protein [Salmonella enterica subsp. enterica]
MNTLIKNVPIAKAGKIFDGREITRHMLERCVAKFDPEVWKPRVNDYIVDIRSPNKGEVIALRLENDTLLADIKMWMEPDEVRAMNLYPAIWYREEKKEEPYYPALIDISLLADKGQEDAVAIKDCDISEGV